MIHFIIFPHPTASLLVDSKENELPENSIEAYPKETRVSEASVQEPMEKKIKLGHHSVLLYYNIEK